MATLTTVVGVSKSFLGLSGPRRFHDLVGICGESYTREEILGACADGTAVGGNAFRCTSVRFELIDEPVRTQALPMVFSWLRSFGNSVGAPVLERHFRSEWYNCAGLTSFVPKED